MVRRGMLGMKVTAAAAVLAVVTLAVAGAAGPVAGPRPDGTAFTPHGWRVTPAGTQTDLGLWPMDIAMSPSGNLLLVANAGNARHSLMTLDPATGRVSQTIRASGAKSHGWWDYASGHPTGYYVGIAFSPDGRRAWAADGPGSAIHDVAPAVWICDSGTGRSRCQGAPSFCRCSSTVGVAPMTT